MEFQGFDPDLIETYIIKTMLIDDLYTKFFVTRVSPNLFSFKHQQLIKSIIVYYKKYNKIPPLALLEERLIPLACNNKEEEVKKSVESLHNILAISFDHQTAYEWLMDETKKFIRNRNIMNAIVKCAEKIEKNKHEEVISIMENAFRIDFDDSMGMDYYEGLEERAIRSGESVEVISTGLRSMDASMGGGYRRKTLSIFAGPANTGKTLWLNYAAAFLSMSGYNVLYLTLELPEDYIAQRTDAMFADVKMEEINLKPQEAIKKAIAKRNLMKKNGEKLGRLIYKEYSPGSTSTNDIKALLKKLELKKDFKPDFIIVDYIKLLNPSGASYSENTYGKLHTVSIELRAMAMEYNCAVLTATQTGRQSYGAKNIGMSDVSDSIAIVQNADFVITLARTKEFDQENMMSITLSKSRFSRNDQSFFVSVDYEYMRLIDISENSRYVDHINDVKDKSKKSKTDDLTDISKGDFNAENENSQELDL